MFKKILSLSLIALMLFSCLANINAGLIQYHRNSNWAGGYWFNDWTAADGSFKQTTYTNGWNANYNTVGNTGKIEIVGVNQVFLTPLPPLVQSWEERLLITNYDGRTLFANFGVAGPKYISFYEDGYIKVYKHKNDGDSYTFPLNASHNDRRNCGWWLASYYDMLNE